MKPVKPHIGFMRRVVLSSVVARIVLDEDFDSKSFEIAEQPDAAGQNAAQYFDLARFLIARTIACERKAS